MTMTIAPRVIATVGLHGSASTWVFNVVRELLIASVGEGNVLAVYAERPDELPDEVTRTLARHLVVKSHHGSAELDAWLAAAQAQLILSIRDPRDACLSMAQRFNARLDVAARWLANDCRRLLRLSAQDLPLLRYEDRFFEDPAAVGRLAEVLGVSVAPADLAAIAARPRDRSRFLAPDGSRDADSRRSHRRCTQRQVARTAPAAARAAHPGVWGIPRPIWVSALRLRPRRSPRRRSAPRMEAGGNALIKIKEKAAAARRRGQPCAFAMTAHSA
jgi:hypothetical protein